MKQKIRLTKSEREIMDVLWKQGEALTSSEIIEVSTNRSWGNTSIHLLLKSLLDKSVIEVDGLKRIAKNYARTFRAAISQYDYFFQEDFQEMSLEKRMKFIETIIQNASLEELDEIKKIIYKIRYHSKEYDIFLYCNFNVMRITYNKLRNYILVFIEITNV